MGKRPDSVFRCLVVLVGWSVLSGCAATRSKSSESSPLVVVEQYLAALNRRDLLMLTAYVTPDVEWYSMVKGERLKELAGRDALRQALTSYFSQNEDTRWSIEQSMVVEQNIAVRERSEWRAAEGSGERVTLVAYELRDGRIARITYFVDAP